MRLSLSKRIALLVGGLILTVALSLGYTALKLSTDSLLKQTEEALSMSAHSGIQIVEAVIEKDLGVLLELANRQEVKTMDWETQRKSMASDASSMGFLEIGVVTADGIAHYVSDDSTADLGDRDYIKKAFQGQANISNVLISRATNQAVMMFAAPIKMDNKVVGVLLARKDGTALSEITEHLGFGENGYSFILGMDGTLYAHDNKDYVMEQRNIIAEIETDGEMKPVGLAFKALGMGNSGVITYDFLGSKRIMGVEPIPGTGWILAVGAYESEALAGLVRMQSGIFYGSIAILILGIAFAMLLGRSISRPIVEYSKIIDRLANYDLSFDENSKAIKYLKRKDEIGIIGNSLAAMQKNLIELIRQITNISQQVASSSEELTATSQESATASEEVARAIEDIAKGATEQAKDTENGAVHIEELGRLIERNRSDVTNLTGAADEINRLKDEGLETIKVLVEKTIASGGAAKEVNEIIINTNESAGKIQNASEMIRSIASQTNLLALNAAIEAARAGDAGKGFAVVAQEIRKLAEESNRFTEEISAIIQELSQKTGIAVKTMQEVGVIVQSQAESVEMTNNKFAGIAHSIENMKELIVNIDESEALMEAKKSEVIHVIQNLSAISQENAATTEEASASIEEQTASIAEIANASESLAQLANEMQESVIKFKH